MDLTSTAAARRVEGPTPDWWPPAEPVAHNAHAADLRMTRASKAAPRDSPVAIAAASRNAIQEAKNRKAAARARMAQRRNAPVRNQGGEGDEGGTRDLWERFGQVAPPPPRTLVVVKRPQPLRRRDGATKSVSLHPLQARIYCDSYNVGGDGELYLRLSDGAADESSGWIYQAVADSGVVPGAIGIYWSWREDTGFGLGAAPTVLPWQPTPESALATLRLSCAPTRPPAAGEKFRVDKTEFRTFLTKYHKGSVVKVGERILVYYAATKSKPEMRITLTVEGMKFAGEQSLSFGQIAATTSFEIEKAAGAGENFIVRDSTLQLDSVTDYVAFGVALVLVIIGLPFLILWKALEWACKRLGGDAAAAEGDAAPAAAPADVAAAGGDAAVEAQPGGFAAFLAGVGKFATDLISVLIVVFFITLVLMLAVTAVRESFVFVCGINFLAPIRGAIRAAVDAVVASTPFKLALCVLYAFGPEDIKASSPGNIALREELAKDGSSAEAVETTIIVMRGMCIGWGVVEIALSLFGATLLLKVCRYFIPVEY